MEDLDQGFYIRADLNDWALEFDSSADCSDSPSQWPDLPLGPTATCKELHHHDNDLQPDEDHPIRKAASRRAALVLSAKALNINAPSPPATVSRSSRLTARQLLSAFCGMWGGPDQGSAHAQLRSLLCPAPLSHAAAAAAAQDIARGTSSVTLHFEPGSVILLRLIGQATSAAALPSSRTSLGSHSDEIALLFAAGTAAAAQSAAMLAFIPHVLDSSMASLDDISSAVFAKWAVARVNDLRLAHWLARAVLASSKPVWEPVNPSVSGLGAFLYATAEGLCENQAEFVQDVVHVPVFGPTVAAMARCLLEETQRVSTAAAAACAFVSGLGPTDPQVTLLAVHAWLSPHVDHVVELRKVLERAVDGEHLAQPSAEAGRRLDRAEQPVANLVIAVDCVASRASKRVLDELSTAVDAAAATAGVRQARGTAGWEKALKAHLPRQRQPYKAFPMPPDRLETLQRVYASCLSTYVASLTASLHGPTGAVQNASRLCAQGTGALAEIPLRPVQYEDALCLAMHEHVARCAALVAVASATDSSEAGIAAEAVLFGRQNKHERLDAFPQLALNRSVAFASLASYSDCAPAFLLTPAVDMAGFGGAVIVPGAVSSDGCLLDVLARLPGDSVLLQPACEQVCMAASLKSVIDSEASALVHGVVFKPLLALVANSATSSAQAVDAPVCALAAANTNGEKNVARTLFDSHPSTMGGATGPSAQVWDERVRPSGGFGPEARSALAMPLDAGPASVLSAVSTVRPVFGPGYAPLPGTSRSSWWDIDAQVVVKKGENGTSEQGARSSGVGVMSGPSKTLARGSSFAFALGPVDIDPIPEGLEDEDDEDDDETNMPQESQKEFIADEEGKDEDEDEEEDGVVWTDEGTRIVIPPENIRKSIQAIPAVVFASPRLHTDVDVTGRAHKDRVSKGEQALAEERRAQCPSIPVLWDSAEKAWNWLRDDDGQPLTTALPFTAVTRLASNMIGSGYAPSQMETVDISLRRTLLPELRAQAQLVASSSLQQLLSPHGCGGVDVLRALRDVACGAHGPVLGAFTARLFASLDGEEGAGSFDVRNSTLLSSWLQNAISRAGWEGVSDTIDNGSYSPAAHAGRFTLSFTGYDALDADALLRTGVSLHYDCSVALMQRGGGTAQPELRMAGPSTASALTTHLLTPDVLASYSSVWAAVHLSLGHAVHVLQQVSHQTRRGEEFTRQCLRDIGYGPTWRVCRSGGRRIISSAALEMQLPQLRAVGIGLAQLQEARRLALHFVSVVHAHICRQVVGPPWLALTAALASVRSCAEAREAHARYIRAITRAAFLAPGQAAARGALHSLQIRAVMLGREVTAAYTAAVTALDEVRSEVLEELGAGVERTGEGGGGSAPALHPLAVDECRALLTPLVRQLAGADTATQALKRQVAFSVRAAQIAGMSTAVTETWGAGTAGVQPLPRPGKDRGFPALVFSLDFNGYYSRQTGVVARIP